jgi:hypothetical protein
VLAVSTSRWTRTALDMHVAWLLGAARMLAVNFRPGVALSAGDSLKIRLFGRGYQPLADVRAGDPSNARNGPARHAHGGIGLAVPGHDGARVGCARIGVRAQVADMNQSPRAAT